MAGDPAALGALGLSPEPLDEGDGLEAPVGLAMAICWPLAAPAGDAVVPPAGEAAVAAADPVLGPPLDAAPPADERDVRPAAADLPAACWAPAPDGVALAEPEAAPDGAGAEPPLGAALPEDEGDAPPAGAEPAAAC